MKRTLLYVLVVFCVITVGHVHVSYGAQKQNYSNIPETLVKKQCQEGKADACFWLGQRCKKPGPALYYYSQSYILSQDAAEKAKTSHMINRLVDNTLAGENRRDKMCVVIQVLPQALASDIISMKTNTIDQAIEAVYGSFRSVISHSNISLGVQVDYTLQTFVNAIRQLYAVDDGKYALTITYLAAKENTTSSFNLEDTMTWMLQSLAHWISAQDLFGRREGKPQYGTAYLLMDLMRDNIEGKLLQDIIAQLISGNARNARILIEKNPQVIDEAVKLTAKIAKDKCGLPHYGI